ncbi:MAG TPA: Fe-S cluster assembly protein SufD [Burkholderiaceae bacterium]|nr:Fe-S cluster assembly protein SufD [Burkholderiaceae bacterium]
MTEAAIIDRYREQFTQLAPRQAGAQLPWLQRARARAFDRFAELGFPTTRLEEWKYTSVAALEKRAFHVAAASDGIDLERVASLALPGCHLLVFVNGRYMPSLSRIGTLPAGARLGSTAAAIESSGDRLESFLTADAATLVNGFTALNAAFWDDGAYVDLAPGVALDAPVHLLFIATAADAAFYPRNIIRAGAGARAEIIEHYVGADEPSYFTNAVTQIVAEAGAALVHAKLQQESGRGFHIADVRAVQGADSRFTSLSFALGGLVSRTEIATRLNAEGCAATLLGLYLPQGRQHMDHHTRIDHAQPRGTSRELYKGVLDGASRAVFNGKVIVYPNAQRTDAEQSNRNLLLSENAEVDTKPQLEIFADDVKCSHGATVGQLDAGQVFYLRSRGIDETAARALLTLAFAREVVTRVDTSALRARIEALLLARFGNGHTLNFGEAV